MNAGVSCYCFNPMLVSGEIRLSEVIELIGRRTQSPCIELLTRYWDPGRDENEQARAAREQTDRVGLRVSCYTLDSDFAVYDEAGHRACVEACKARLEAARILGADTIRLDPRTSLRGAGEGSIDLDDVIARMAAGMAEVADAAAAEGIRVGVENHGRLLGRSAQIAALVERVDRPNFGVNLDFTNFRTVYGEDHVEAARHLARHVVHVHAKDFHISREPQAGEGWQEIPTGESVRRATGGAGDAQWPVVFAILKDAGYAGTVSLEISLPEDIEASVAHGVENLRRVLAELEGSGA